MAEDHGIKHKFDAPRVAVFFGEPDVTRKDLCFYGSGLKKMELLYNFLVYFP